MRASVVIVSHADEERTRRTRQALGQDVTAEVARGPAAAAYNRAVERARTEVVAFLEAGSEPEAGWLKAFLAAFSDSRIAGVAGRLCRPGESSANWRWPLCDRRGLDAGTSDDPIWARCMPGADVFPRLPPGNCALRRDYFLDAGGLDEQMSWPLPLAGLCARWLDRGLWLRAAPDAIVHQASAGDRWPRAAELLKSPEATAQTAVRFALAHCPHQTAAATLSQCQAAFEEALAPIERHDPGRAAVLRDGIERGLWAGARDGQRGQRPATKTAPVAVARPVSISRPRPLTVSLVTGLIVPRDAISNICREQMDAVTRWAEETGRPLSLRAFALDCRPEDARVSLVRSAAAVAADEHFARSDVIHYNFGIYYPLFDSIHLAPRSARVSVTYYGITHPHLIAGGGRGAAERSYRQAANLLLADRVLTTSRFLVRELERFGVAPGRVEVIPLPGSGATGGGTPAALAYRGGLYLAYLGRFVSAKRVHDLLDAAGAFARAGGRLLSVDLIGTKAFAEAGYIESLRRQADDLGIAAAVRFHHDVSEAERDELLPAADAVVIPSLHEGFCVPVIEAMQRGRFVICSDATALPETAGGLGRTYPAGDAGALARRVAEFVAGRQRGGFATDSGFVPEAEWLERAAAHVARFTRERFREAFCAAVLGGVIGVNDEARAALESGRRALLRDCLSPPVAG